MSDSKAGVPTNVSEAGAQTSPPTALSKPETDATPNLPKETICLGQAESQVLPNLELGTHPIFTMPNKAFSRLSTAGKALLAVVLLPAVLSLLYFGLLASPMYISEARFAVRSAENSGTARGLAAMLLPSGASVGTDTHIVAEYIRSPDIMEAVDREMRIFSHFSSQDYNVISRLGAGATRDERLTYWNWAVKASFDLHGAFLYEPAGHLFE